MYPLKMVLKMVLLQTNSMTLLKILRSIQMYQLKIPKMVLLKTDSMILLKILRTIQIYQLKKILKIDVTEDIFNDIVEDLESN